MAEFPVVAGLYGWAKLGLHAGWQNGMEKLEGGWEGVVPRSAEPLWLSKPGAMPRKEEEKGLCGV